MADTKEPTKTLRLLIEVPDFDTRELDEVIDDAEPTGDVAADLMEVLTGEMVRAEVGLTLVWHPRGGDDGDTVRGHRAVIVGTEVVNR